MTDTSHPEGSPPSSAPESPPVSAATPEDAVAVARKEATASHDRYMRAVADLENYRKRVLREKEELRQAATAGVIEDIIPIIDNLNLGLTAARQQTDVKTVVDGIAMVLEQFKTVLVRQGLKEINPAGAEFDPHLHECISHQPSPTVPSEKVIQVVRLGYQLNNRLLRPASVIVSSGPAEKS
ncbi:MAG TPA: nucleotide exchange factor GrpE [Candidatus Didemnitutus sp.]|jgi:molecular chaperone GrpE